MAGFVYLIRNGDLYKIGRSDNLSRRMKQLRPDEVLQVLETDRSRDLEYELHEQFKAKRLPQTEYFRLDELEVNLVRMALGWQPNGPVGLPPMHALHEDIAEARSKVNRAGIATALLLVALIGEGFIFGADGNLLEGLLTFATLLGLLASSVVFLGSAADYAVRWGWRKLRGSKG